MPNIMPISDLRNYSDVLHSVTPDSPVFLTKNGRGRYAILDIDEYEKLMSTVKLLSELAKGRKSANEQGSVPIDEAVLMLGITL
ncbi:MAG: type II toxin-antitoxin system prevent-host-death family antitoxin [Ruminococcaceae bacterium]|nr:type II toxin-antitoxin system prevent-host-death family antitoxin [Oscillospiraceae bacterium]